MLENKLMPTPTITAVMLTMPGRAALRHEALKCLANQSRPVDELVIAFDGDDRLSMPEATAISHIPCRPLYGTWANVTEKYNAALALASSEWVTLWDDDDWCGSRRIADVMIKNAAAPMADIIGPCEILYHELIGTDRRTVKFVTKAHVVDGASAFRRALWQEHPFHLVKSRHPNAARVANIGDWIVRRVAGGVKCATVDFPYVAMIHGGNATMARPFRVAPKTNEVYDGPDDFTVAGGREIALSVMGETALHAYEAALPPPAKSVKKP